MNNKVLKRLSLLGLTFSSSIAIGACNDKKIEFNQDCLFGICEVSGEISMGVDSALTNDWIASRVKALGCKAMRLWVSFNGLFSVDNEDNLSINQQYYLGLKDHVDKLVDAGIERFLCMTTSYLYPFDYSATTGYAAPDPKEENDYYQRFIHLQAKASKQIAELFPMIDYFEPGNEPDISGQSCLHRNGYVFGQGPEINNEYYYTVEEQTAIIADLGYYIRKAIREVDEKNKTVFPGLTFFSSVPDYLEVFYEQIEAKMLPMGTKYSDKDPDHYYDVINWHPYPSVYSGNDDPDDDWLELNTMIHDVMVRHGDKEKPVFLSEFGYTDYGNRELQDKHADYYIKAFNNVKENFPWIESLFCFRLTNLVHQQLDNTGGEENFGLFYNPDDPLYPGEPKKSAIALAKYFNGENYELN